MLLLTISTKYVVIISAILAVVVLLSIIATVVLVKKKNNGHVKVDDTFVENIMTWLGEKENIISLNVDNARLKVEVKDLDKVLADKLHTVSEKGVFITGNYVKLLFKYDSKLIMKEISKRL